jgi:Ca-activated chloride channel family protein
MPSLRRTYDQGEEATMKAKWAWVLGITAGLGLAAAAMVPSLLRARVVGGTPPEPAKMATPALPRPAPLLAGAAPPATVVPRPAPTGVPRQFLEDDAGTPTPVPFDTEGYDRIRDNPFVTVASAPLSTFSVDVDTASYANVRRFLKAGRLPPPDAVRIEELLNYFRYDYPEPRGREPFSITTEVASCPWQPAHRLVLVGLQGRTIPAQDVPPRNLVFLVDVSGSMDEPNKLPLLQTALGMLVDRLRPEDRVAIVVYAGSSGLALPSTSGEDKGRIREALEDLRAGGSTAGGAGIELAYRVAAEHFVEGGVNRVILATDGDFNVGVTSRGDLSRLIEAKRKTGVFLSVLGFGAGNLKDSTMESLADEGNGNYSYIDSPSEARKVLVSEAGGTLVTIAKDVKVQVEFNPRTVGAYRLIGYENRALRAEDFNNDAKDAGEIGAGHSVTALYEVVPKGVAVAAGTVDPLKYQQAAPASAASGSGELLTVKLRHQDPEGGASRLQSVSVADVAGEPSTGLRFASAVAEFGMLLRGSEHRGRSGWGQVVERAQDALGDDPEGHRAEFVELARTAAGLAGVRRIATTR